MLSKQAMVKHQHILYLLTLLVKMRKVSKSTKYIGLGIALGSSFGVTMGAVIGSLKNDVPTWVSYGIIIGMILGLVISIIYGSLIQEKTNIEKNKTSK